MTQVFVTIQYNVSCTQLNITVTSNASFKQRYMCTCVQLSDFLTLVRSMRDRQLETGITTQVTYSVIQRDGLNFVRPYFLIHTCCMNDLHRI